MTTRILKPHDDSLLNPGLNTGFNTGFECLSFELRVNSLEPGDENANSKRKTQGSKLF